MNPASQFHKKTSDPQTSSQTQAPDHAAPYPTAHTPTKVTDPIVSVASPRKRRLFNPGMAIFTLMFAGIGAYLVFYGHADTITKTKTWQTAADWTTSSVQNHVTTSNSGVTLATTTQATTQTATTKTDLALYRPAVASSTESQQHPARAVTDGNATSRWASRLLNRGKNGRNSEWVYVDLGKTSQISEVKLYWERAYGKAYQLQTSNNAKTWTTVYTTTASDGGLDDITGLHATGRYIRMYGMARGTQWGYSLYSFQVFGGSPATTTTAPAYVGSGDITLTFDAGGTVTWGTVTPVATTPNGTSLKYQYATSDDGQTWSNWSNSATSLLQSRYIHLRASLATNDTSVTPTLSSLKLTYATTAATPPTPAPTVNLSAAQPSVASGGTTTLIWNSTNATSCTASGGWLGTRATSGNVATGALLQAQTYTLTCSGAGGSKTASVTVFVATTTTGNGNGSGSGTGGTGGGSTTTTGGCSVSSVVAPCIGGTTTGATGWGTPTFDDEFNGTSLDSTHWANSWFKGGTMNNVSTSSSNVAVTGGNLVLTLSSSSTGALVNTNPNDAAGKGYTFTYGYAEARIYFPGSGSSAYNWPAWWTDSQNWPSTGEIDVAEVLGGNMTSNYHYGTSNTANNSGTIAGNWVNAFHTFGVDREPGKNTIYWDGQPIRSYTTYDNGAPHYLIFNVGKSTTAITGTASQVKVDYVRVWVKP